MLLSPVTAQKDKFGEIECTKLTAVDAAGAQALELRAVEHGRHVVARGKGEGMAMMSITEYGNGAVSTWDKNGHRQI